MKYRKEEEEEEISSIENWERNNEERDKVCRADHQLVQSGNMHKTEEDSEARFSGHDATLPDHDRPGLVLLDAQTGGH